MNEKHLSHDACLTNNVGFKDIKSYEPNEREVEALTETSH